jgi:hypothetical protein
MGRDGNKASCKRPGCLYSIFTMGSFTIALWPCITISKSLCLSMKDEQIARGTRNGYISGPVVWALGTANWWPGSRTCTATLVWVLDGS